MVVRVSPCPACKGARFVDDEPCPLCGGTGVREQDVGGRPSGHGSPVEVHRTKNEWDWYADAEEAAAALGVQAKTVRTAAANFNKAQPGCSSCGGSGYTACTHCGTEHAMQCIRCGGTGRKLPRKAAGRFVRWAT